MNTEHITTWLARRPLHELSATELAQIQTHTAICAACRQAYTTARLAETLCQARAVTTVEPPPFFETRVLAALRAQRAQAEPLLFARFWQAARGLVAAMSLAVALLLAFTFVDNVGTLPDPVPDAAAYFSSEASLAQTFDPDEPNSALANDPSDESLTDAQVVKALYSDDDWEEQ